MHSMSPFVFSEEADAITTISKVTRWRQEKLGRFPKRVKLANRKCAYRRKDIEDWAQDPEGWRARNSRAAG